MYASTSWKKGALRPLAALAAVIAALTFDAAAARERVSYFILAGTMEPLMIQEPGDPMAGGMFTEILQAVFDGSPYELRPEVMPWQRMREELKTRDDWVMHGIPAFFEPDIPYELSAQPVFPFNHVTISLKENSVAISRVEDLFNLTVILVENYHYPGLDRFLDAPVAGAGSGDISSVRAFKPDGTIRMLRHGRGDVVIGFEPRLLYHLRAAGLGASDVVVNDASMIIATEQMHVAFSPGQPNDLKRHINRRLAEMRADGDLARIVEPYYRDGGG